MPSKYKITYFNARGRAEPSRFMFALAGVEFEDFRIELKDWAEWKPKIQKINPMGVLPILEIDGDMKIFQSAAINRYLARTLGFMGSANSLEEARIDVIYECLIDLLKPLYDIYAEKDEEKKKGLLKKFQEETCEKTLSDIEVLWEQNETDEFLVGKKISLADIFFFDYVHDILKRFLPTFNLDGHPKLKILAERLESIPQINKWLKERPVTER